jgi:hypothetical protein
MLQIAPNPYVTPQALSAGFSNEPIGTHTGKTMMLSELRLLLGAVPGPASYADYRHAAVEGNALAKATAANRSNTLKYVKQIYGLRPELPVFAALRELWPVSSTSQPLLAMLCANARDILYRVTSEVVLATPGGSHVEAEALTARISEVFPGRYSASTLRNLGQNIASSWTQAGLLAGTRAKRRAHPIVDYPAVVYALYLGHLEGAIGPALFDTRWAHLLDTEGAVLREMAESSARSGWLEYRSSGGMTGVTFHHLDGLTGWKGV